MVAQLIAAAVAIHAVPLASASYQLHLHQLGLPLLLQHLHPFKQQQ